MCNDSSGTHSITTSVYSGDIASQPIPVGNIDVAASEEARNEIIRFLKGRRTWKARVRGLLKRSEEHTSELQSLMRISYAVFCLKKKQNRENKYNIDPTYEKTQPENQK